MAKETEQRLIKSRERVRDHGEVFTPDWLVRDMCDLVAAQCADVGTRFLEPACGDGNFLVEIFRRKLRAARRLSGGRNDTARFRRAAFDALTSLYGIDILPDNVAACRAALLARWEGAHGKRLRGQRQFPTYLAAARFVLERNIVLGDTLHPEGTETHPPIVFTEWLWQGDAVARAERSLADLLDDSDCLPFAALPNNAFPPVPYHALAPLSAAAPPPGVRRAVEAVAPGVVQMTLDL